MKIIGHRGARGLAPENSILAIRVAMRENVDMIELDIQLKNTDVVLAHDPIVAGERYTHLHEALKKIHGKVAVNLEIKPQKGVAPEDIVALLKGELKSYKGKVVISSYSYKILKEVQRVLPKIEIAVLERWSGVRAVTKASMLNVHRIHINHTALWSGFVRSMKHKNYELYAYTVNLSDRAEELEAWGIDGICTDYPNLFNNQ